MLDTGAKNLEVGAWKLEVGARKLEVGARSAQGPVKEAREHEDGAPPRLACEAREGLGPIY